MIIAQNAGQLFGGTQKGLRQIGLPQSLLYL